MFGWNKNVLISRTCLCINWIFVFIQTICAPQSKSSVRPAAAIYSRDKCDKISYSRDANVLYSRDIVFYIQGTSIYGFMWEWWEVARYSGFTDESWCNVQVGQKMFDRWDNFIDRWETPWTLDQVFDCFRNNKPTI